MTELVVVARCSFPHEAYLARASLETAGFPVVIADEHTINMNWLYSNAIGGVKVMVPAEFADEARDLLATDYSAQVESEQGSDATSCCPSCGSANVSPYTIGKKPTFLVILLLGLPLFFHKYGLKCGNCGTFWKI